MVVGNDYQTIFLVGNGRICLMGKTYPHEQESHVDVWCLDGTQKQQHELQHIHGHHDGIKLNKSLAGAIMMAT